MKLSQTLFVPMAVAALAFLPSLATAQAVNPVLASLSPVADADLAAAASSSSNSSLPQDSMSTTAAPAPAATAGSGGPFSGVGVGFKIGVGGIGFDVATPLIPGRLNLRGGAGFFSYSTTFTASSDNILGTLKLNNSEAMLDYFPFHGGFRLSAGLTVYNDTALNGTLSFTGGSSFTVGNSKYTSDPANPTTGTAAFKFGGNTVPRFTLGWGNMVKPKGHWSFNTEIGIEYIGDPTVTWNLSGEACTTTTTSPGVQCSSDTYGAVAPADIAQEQTNLQNDLNGLKVFPILQLGLSYRIH